MKTVSVHHPFGKPNTPYGALAQLGERGLCKPEVRGSIPLCSTIRYSSEPPPRGRGSLLLVVIG